MLHKLMGLVLVVAGIVLAVQSHWIIGVVLLIAGAVLATAHRRNRFTTDTGSAYDGGSGWTTGPSSSDWNTSSNGNDGHRDCSTGDNDGGSDSGGGDCGGGDGGGGD